MVSDKLIGVQIGAHSIFDEGANHCLDLLTDTAGVNALFVYSHTYQQFARGRTLEALADHGLPVPDPSTRNLPQVWVTPHDEFYTNTSLRHHIDPASEYAGRDVLAELAEPAKKRGIKLYARILEGSGTDLVASIPNWIKALTVDVYGRIYHLPCWNNPDYRNWWLGTVEDLFKSYDLDGFQFGSERVGPLSNVILKNEPPVCFCRHCLAKAVEQGISIERARVGWRKLHETMNSLYAGEAVSNDNVMIVLFRLFMQYPEILEWQQLWRQSREALSRLIYGAAKAIRPDADVGIHIDHQQSTWDLFHRAEMSYEEMTPFADFIKPIVYHDILGPRIRHWYFERIQSALLRDVSLEQSLKMFYLLRGYDPDKEPALEDLSTTGFSEEYVYKETLRCVQSVNGKARVYAGVGFDVPWNREHFYSDPEKVYAATYRAFDAGADGIVISREYDEMRVENLRAVGRAVKSINT